MAFAPQQDWAAYEAQAAESDAAFLRGLTPGERFALYADLFNIVWNARSERGDWERLERWSWQQKLAGRRRMVEAFEKLDQLRRERAAANDPSRRG